MECEETLDSMRLRFRVSHHRSLRGVLRAAMVAIMTFAGSWGFIILTAGLPSPIDVLSAMLLCAAVIFTIAPYLSEQCEVTLTANQLSILDRGRRQRFSLEDISALAYQNTALKMRVQGQERLLFKDIAKEDALSLCFLLENHCKAYKSRMRLQGHDLSTPARPPAALDRMTERS